MRFSESQRLTAVICISTSFFLAELSIGLYTKSLALVADAFHCLNDLISFAVALAAMKISQRPNSPEHLSFGWQRARLLGSFFNGVFLLALGVSISLQSVDRFISLREVEDPQLMLIVGSAGLILNLISATFLHNHDHDHDNHGHGHSHHHGHARKPLPNAEDLEQSSEETLVDTNSTLTAEFRRRHEGHRHLSSRSIEKGWSLDALAVETHVLMDAINNIGVMAAALVIWRTDYAGRFYADPGVSMGTSILMMVSSLFLIYKTSRILLQAVPDGINIEDVKHDIEKIPGIESVHELHIWSLCQMKAIATAHVITAELEVKGFAKQAKLITECFHAYGIHSVTLQAETPDGVVLPGEKCSLTCGSLCEDLTCCG